MFTSFVSGIGGWGLWSFRMTNVCVFVEGKRKKGNGEKGDQSSHVSVCWQDKNGFRYECWFYELMNIRIELSMAWCPLQPVTYGLMFTV